MQSLSSQIAEDDKTTCTGLPFLMTSAVVYGLVFATAITMTSPTTLTVFPSANLSVWKPRQVVRIRDPLEARTTCVTGGV